MIKKLDYPIMSEDNTAVYYDDDSVNYGAPHEYIVKDVHTGQELAHVNFQNGPTKEVALNGIFNEDLIYMVLDRLKKFQNTKYDCEENAEAIKKLEEALMWLRYRSYRRKKENTFGTSKGN